MLSEADGWQLRERKSKGPSPLASFPGPPSFFFFFHFSFRVVLSTGQWGDAQMPSPLCTCALAQNMVHMSTLSISSFSRFVSANGY